MPKHQCRQPRESRDPGQAKPENWVYDTFMAMPMALYLYVVWWYGCSTNDIIILIIIVFSGSKQCKEPWP